MSKQLGSAIKSMRKSRDWTQAKLGELLNVSDKTISSWEKGRTEPKLEEMIRIADIFNISVTSLSNLPWEHLKASSDSSQWIPVMGRVAAGIPLDMIEDVLDYEEIPDHMGEYTMIKTWHKIKKNPVNRLTGSFFRWWRLGESNISHMALIKGYYGNV